MKLGPIIVKMLRKKHKFDRPDGGTVIMAQKCHFGEHAALMRTPIDRRTERAGKETDRASKNLMDFLTDYQPTLLCMKLAIRFIYLLIKCAGMPFPFRPTFNPCILIGAC